MKKKRKKPKRYCGWCNKIRTKHKHVFCKKCKRVKMHCECNVDPPALVVKDQQYLSISYGNEDKFEEQGSHNFECPKKLAKYLRLVAGRIEKYKNSKEYRASDEYVLRRELD